MKLLTGSALALTISLGAMCPAFAGMVPSGEINGEVQSIDGSTLTIRAEDGQSHEFSIDPNLVSAFNLEAGRSVRIDGSRLRRGVITGVDDNTVKVRHDNGESETYILFRESRRYLSYGDRVVVNSQGRVISENDYRLTATEIIPVHSFLTASTTSTQTTIASTQIESEFTEPEFEVAPVDSVVEGLW